MSTAAGAGGGAVDTYVSFFRYTPQAWERMVADPADRSAAARRLIEAMGGRMASFHWMLGPWDGMCVYRVPSTVTAAAMNAGMLTSRVLGAVETHRLIEAGEAEAALRRAREVRGAMDPPGGSRWYAEYDAFVAEGA